MLPAECSCMVHIFNMIMSGLWWFNCQLCDAFIIKYTPLDRSTDMSFGHIYAGPGESFNYMWQTQGHQPDALCLLLDIARVKITTLFFLTFIFLTFCNNILSSAFWQVKKIL